MKRNGKIALGIFITILILLAAGGIGGAVYLYQNQKGLKAEAAASEGAKREAETQREMLRIELEDAKEKLKAQSVATGTAVAKHPLSGMTPVEIVKLTLTLRGEDLTKFAFQEKSNDGKKAEIWIGPLNSEFGKAYDFVRQDDEWILTNIRELGS